MVNFWSILVNQFWSNFGLKLGIFILVEIRAKFWSCFGYIWLDFGQLFADYLIGFWN